MPASEHLLDELAGAVLDGAPVDWPAAESSAGAEARLIRQLRLVESVALVHRHAIPALKETGPATPGPSRSTPDRWGHLQLLERIGRGAFGEVFRAWDPRLDREVALKILPAAGVSNTTQATAIIEEGRLLARVRHPNVVTIHGAEQIGDQIGLWMELVRGQTLDQLVRQGRSFTSKDVASIGHELACALAAVHAAGLIHRDIKAHNVIRAEDGRVVLMDFGTGKELTDRSSSDLTGTPLYLAPEIFAGHPASVRSDIYSLGVLLFYLLTGAYPVPGATIQDVRQAHERRERTSVRARRPEVRPALAQIVERAINPDPDRRFANADALARALSALQGSTRRPLIPLALVAAVLLAGIIGLEIHTRLTGDRRSFGTRLASALGFAPGYVNNPLIAVMPFRTFSGDPRDILLVENVTARLVQQLGIIDGLSVRSQTSSLLLKDKPRDLAEVGRRLNVNLVVEGDAQVSGSTLRINAALVSIDDRLVWSGKVERTLSAEKDIGEVVDELSRKIVDEFRLKLGRTQRRYETSIEIYETYLRGRAAREARLGRRNADAIPLFEEVIRRDPSFAPARAALAAAYAQAASTFPNARGTGISPAEAAARMTPLLQQAYDVDPMLGELHAAWGLLHSMTGEWKKAEASFRRAIELDPTITAVYGDFVLDTLLPWGRVDEAIATMQTALRLDPMSLDARRVLGRAQLDAGHFDAALENCTLVREQDPTYPFVDEICGQALMFKGRTDEALELFNKRADLNEQWIGYIYAITGRRAEAEAVAERNAHLPHRPAMIYSALGDYDRAFEALARLAAVNPRRAASFLSTAELAKLREDPRAAAFRQKLGFPR